MSKIRFVGLDVHAETIAIAVAETNGEVRSLGTIPNRLESIRSADRLSELLQLSRTVESIDELVATLDQHQQ